MHRRVACSTRNVSLPWSWCLRTCARISDSIASRCADARRSPRNGSCIVSCTTSKSSQRAVTPPETVARRTALRRPVATRRCECHELFAWRHLTHLIARVEAHADSRKRVLLQLQRPASVAAEGCRLHAVVRQVSVVGLQVKVRSPFGSDAERAALLVCWDLEELGQALVLTGQRQLEGRGAWRAARHVTGVQVDGVRAR